MKAYMQRGVSYLNDRVLTKTVPEYALEQTTLFDNSNRFVLFYVLLWFCFQNTFDFIFRKESRVLEMWLVRHLVQAIYRFVFF